VCPGYIADAFEIARAAAPTAELFYNDLGAELPGPQPDSSLAMVARFKHADAPIDGVGLQDHTDLPGYPPQDVLQRQLEAFARLGVRVEITELDIGTLAVGGSAAAKAVAQARAYRAEANACWDVAACTRLTTWGLYDGLSWIGSDQTPLLFDTAFRPKPAYAAVAQALHLPPPDPGG
jgi:endo-1,4-beta-xylanase